MALDQDGEPRSEGGDSGGQKPKRLVVRKDKTNPRRMAYLCLLLFAQPGSWGLLVVGGVLVLGAVLFHGWAAGYLARAGYEERESRLTARGPYRYNRNPYYVAQLSMDLGFFCLAGLPLAYLAYFPVIFSVYRRWVLNEEAFLEAEFGAAYREFKGEVPRWGIRLRPAPGRGHDQRFTWATYRENRELHRTLSHLGLLGVFVAYFFFGNPVAGMNPWALGTGVVVYGGWLLVRDVFPVEESGVRVVWLYAAVLIAIAGTLLVLNAAPLWHAWPERAHWIGLAAGLACGLAVANSTLPARREQRETSRGDIFPRPLCQWYILLLGLGLFSGYFGGVLGAVLLALVLWAVHLSGVIPLRRLPESRAVSFVVVIVFAGAAAVFASRLVHGSLPIGA